jgi:RNA polymerase sigma-70 factor (ECF subfamily)
VTHAHNGSDHRAKVREAFTEHGQSVYGYLISLGATHHEAEDTLQEVLANILKKDRGIENYEAYMIRAARNSYLRLKDQKKKECVTDEDSGIPVVVSEDGSPARGILNAELRVDLENALKRLPDPHREAFVLHNQEDLSYEEIAERTGRKVGTVRQHHARAVQALRSLLTG